MFCSDVCIIHLLMTKNIGSVFYECSDDFPRVVTKAGGDSLIDLFLRHGGLIVS